MLVVHEAFGEAFLGWAAGKYILAIGNCLLQSVTDASMYVQCVFSGVEVCSGSPSWNGALENTYS